MERITGPLAIALAKQRDALNAKFAAARTFAAVDADAFGNHLASVVSPIVSHVADVLAEKVESVTTELFDTSLELFQANLLGPEAKEPWVVEVWRRLLPQLTLLMAREPGRIAASASNAVVNLSATYGARPQLWIERMLTVGPLCETAHQFLDCGALAAWQAGMAQYRTSAFESAQRLPTRLTATALELAADLSRDHLNQLLRRLQADRWLTPAQALTGASTSSLTIVKQVGAFRGFGGPFMRPPSVCCQREELLVTDGEATWRLIADACGGVLIRATEKMNREPGSNVTVDSRGSVRWNGESAIFPELAHVKSFAAANQTLAVTLPTSHHIFLLAKAPQDDVRPHGGPTRVG